jgi:hypothetical protein
LDCGVVASEAKLVHGDDVVNRYCFFYSLENKSFEYFGQCRQKTNRSVRVISVGGVCVCVCVYIYIRLVRELTQQAKGVSFLTAINCN